MLIKYGACFISPLICLFPNTWAHTILIPVKNFPLLCGTTLFFYPKPIFDLGNMNVHFILTQTLIPLHHHWGIVRNILSALSFVWISTGKSIGIWSSQCSTFHSLFTIETISQRNLVKEGLNKKKAFITKLFAKPENMIKSQKVYYTINQCCQFSVRFVKQHI